MNKDFLILIYYTLVIYFLVGRVQESLELNYTPLVRDRGGGDPKLTLWKPFQPFSVHSRGQLGPWVLAHSLP